MPNNILITPGSANIQFSGSAANTIRLQVEDSGSIAFYGNSGSLFGITDSLSGSLMSVNDISGLPILEVFSDDRVVMGSFGRNTLVVSGSTVTISGSLNVSGSTNGISGGSGAGFPFSGSAVITGSLTVNALEVIASGTIPANGTVGIQLNLASAGYFAVSASGAGTVTWTVINPPVTGRAETFILEYINGGIKTNNWFTNTRWPAATAPTLTTGTASDFLSFTTDDAGSNWRAVLLQRGSA